MQLRTRFIHFLQTNCPLLLVLATGLIVRLTFVTGIVARDDFLYADAARAITRGNWGIINPYAGTRRVGHYFPVALLFELFGPTEAAALAWPLLCSLATIAFIYAIAKLKAGETAGLMAGMVWAFFPADIFLATYLYPDGPVTPFTAAAVYLLLLAETKEGKAKKIIYALLPFVLVYGFVVKESMAVAAFFVAAYLMWKFFPASGKARLYKLATQKRFQVGMVLLALAGLAWYSSLQAPWFPSLLTMTSQDVVDKLSSHTLYYILAPLFLMSVLTTLARRWREAQMILAWAAFTFFYMEWGTRKTSFLWYAPANRFLDQRNLAFMLVPFAILAGIYLSKLMSPQAARRSTIAIAALTLAAGLTIRFGWLPLQVILALAALGLILFLVASIASPLVFSWEFAERKSRFAALLMGSLALGYILPIHTYRSFDELDHAAKQNLREAASLLLEVPPLPIWLAPSFDKWDYSALNLYAGYRFGYDRFADEVGMFISWTGDYSDVGSGYVLVVNTDPGEVPATWWKVADIQQPETPNLTHPPLLSIYRALNAQDAQTELDDARAAVAENASEINLLRLFAAAVNAGDIPAGIQTYRSLSVSGGQQAQWELYLFRLLENYVEENSRALSDNLFVNPSFADGVDGWHIAPQLAGQFELLPDEDGDGQVLKFVNPSDAQIIPLDQTVALKPNTVYVYQVEVFSTVELRALYWKSGEIEQFSFGTTQVYGEWTVVQAMFLTPDWGEGVREVFLAPILFRGQGIAALRSVGLFELILSAP